jgi:hypothetical protein
MQNKIKKQKGGEKALPIFVLRTGLFFFVQAFLARFLLFII